MPDTLTPITIEVTVINPDAIHSQPECEEWRTKLIQEATTNVHRLKGLYRDQIADLSRRSSQLANTPVVCAD